MGLTPKQAWAIGHLVTELRPEWQAEGVVAALKRVADRNPYHVALAAVRAAADPDARTPGVIPAPGTHWQEGIKEQPGKGRPPRKSEECEIHAGWWADSCHGCASDRLAGDKTTPPDLRRPDPTDHVARVRAELAQARATTCPHRRDRNRAHCETCAETTTAPTDRTKETPDGP